MANVLKITMGSILKAPNGEAIRFGGKFGCEPNTMAILQARIFNVFELPEDRKKALQELLDKVMGEPLTLAEACCAALMAAYDDEKNLATSERIKRNQLAHRLYRKGKAKISDEDCEYILSVASKYFFGSLMYPQIKALLEGKEFATGMAEGDEEDEQPQPAS